MWYVSLSDWVTSLVMHSRSVLVVAKGKTSLFFLSFFFFSFLFGPLAQSAFLVHAQLLPVLLLLSIPRAHVSFIVVVFPTRGRLNCLLLKV